MSCTGGACRRKSIEEFRAEAEESTEESSLSLFDLLCIGVGGTVGSGVFVLTGEVYPVAGASSMVCWLIAGAVCLMSAFSYMELSAAIPTRGSTYAFSLHALGEVWAVAGAVSLMMGYGLSGAGVARSWSVKFSVLIGTNLDVGPGYFISWTAGLIQFVAVVLVAIGVSFSKNIVNVMTVLKIVLVFFLIAVGFAATQRNVFEAGDFFAEGAGGVLTGTSYLFFGYIGFDEVCCMAARSQNPRKTIPRAIAGTLFGAALLSTIAQVALVGAVVIEDDDEFAYSFEKSFAQKGWPWAKYTAAFGEVILLPVVVLLSFMPTPEVLAALSNDGIISKKFGEMKGDVYLYACTASGSLLVAIALFVPFAYIWNTINLGVLIGFNLCNLSLLSTRCGNGGELTNPRAANCLNSFVVCAFAAAYVLWKGAFEIPTLNGDTTYLTRYWWWLAIGLIFFAGMVASLCLVAKEIALEAKVPAPPLRTRTKHDSRRSSIDPSALSGKSRNSRGGALTAASSYFICEEDEDLFKAPGVPWLTGAAIFVNFFLMAQYEWMDQGILAAWYVLAYVCYFASRGNKSLQQKIPSMASVATMGIWDET